MTNIISNGSKWAGESPDTIDTLCEVLQAEPLNRIFEPFGNFIIHDAIMVRFWGNFLNLSHVFSIDTDEPALIERLTGLIRANQQRPDYRSQPKPKTVQQRNRETYKRMVAFRSGRSVKP